MTTPTPDHAPSTAAHDEIRAALAILTVTEQVGAGEMTRADAEAVVSGVVLDTFGAYPLDVITPLAVVALRALQLAADRLDTTARELLTQLAGELNGNPGGEAV
jgi:hypothetical protein